MDPVFLDLRWPLWSSASPVPHARVPNRARVGRPNGARPLAGSVLGAFTAFWGSRRRRVTRAAACGQDGLLDADDVEGGVCSIWTTQQPRAEIPEELLHESWSSLIDRAASGPPVRACRKAVKQIATLGPASTDPKMIERLFLSGVDLFRLNFSHGAYEEKLTLVQQIRTVEEKYMHPIGILADLQGPKQRCGQFETSVELTTGQLFRFDLDARPGNETRVQLPHPEILGALSVGSTLLLDDGKLRMRVVRHGGSAAKDSLFAECQVEVGGRLSSNKGVNTPDILLPISPVTVKDQEDIRFACKIHVDWIALSFVQKHEDMEELRELVRVCDGAQPRLVAKIEKPSAVQDLDAILQASDAVMVARGDLGVEMSPEKVPFVQKQIVRQAREAGKPSIVATQMLESMIRCPTPTRAECSDVANAVLDGADAVMLSGETAIGEFAVEAVAIQRRVIEAAESEALVVESVVLEKNTPSESDAVMASAATLAQDVGASALVCFTGSGKSIEGLTPLRPSVPVLAVCPCLETARALTLFRGVYGTSDQDAQMLAGRVEIQGNYAVRFSEGLEVACRLARDKGLTPLTTDRLVVVARLPLFSQGALNTVRLVGAMGPGIADGYGPEDRGLTSFSEGD